jgi:DnaJ-class molecular chaperone
MVIIMYKVYECPKCKGKGYIILRVYDFSEFSSGIFQREDCKKCNCTGTIRELIEE